MEELAVLHPSKRFKQCKSLPTLHPFNDDVILTIPRSFDFVPPFYQSHSRWLSEPVFRLQVPWPTIRPQIHRISEPRHPDD